MRRLWIIPKGIEIDEQILRDAATNNCPEISMGIPPVLQDKLRFQKLPLAYEEPELISSEPRNLAKELDELRDKVDELSKIGSVI